MAGEAEINATVKTRTAIGKRRIILVDLWVRLAKATSTEGTLGRRLWRLPKRLELLVEQDARREDRQNSKCAGTTLG